MLPRLVPFLALAALWWPGRLSGVFDGAPFDTAPDAIVLGLVLPVSLWLVPEAWRDRRAQALVVALLAWKVLAFAVLAQDGLCARVMAPRPHAGAASVVKNWDMRTDWLSAEPACSAVIDRALLEDRQFPMWYLFNFSELAGRPPAAGDAQPLVGRVALSGTVVAREPGTLRLWTSDTVEARFAVDGVTAAASGAALQPGVYRIEIDAALRDLNWRLVPLWNESDLFTALTVTAAPLSTLDRMVRPWGRWVVTTLVSALLIVIAARAAAAVREWQVLAWVALSAAGGAGVAALLPGRRWHFAALLLLAACAVRVPTRWQTLRGAGLLLAPAWLALAIVDTYIDQGFGRLDVIQAGNDWWTFQATSYRIYMEGFWLHGGEDAFWYQPFYRWIAGALHLLFGQSQVGENYWDAAGVFVMALFAFAVVRAVAGFRWGLAAAVLTLTAFISGPGYVFIGRGLSEISSAALICLAALCVMRARETQSIAWLAAAGAAAVLGVWTRLNNLPMALAILAFAWPLTEPVSTLWRPRAWLSSVWWPPVIVIPAALAIGMTLFAWRTWYYTGVFSIFYGTQAATLAVWHDGMPLGEVARAMASSVMMVATTSDPPAYHNGALPIMAGAGLSLAALSGAGLPGRLPLPLVGFTLAAFAGALVARGTAYSGRFSIHVVAATAAVVICAVAALRPGSSAAPDSSVSASGAE